MKDTIVGHWLTSIRSKLSGRRSGRRGCELDVEPFSLSLSVNALQARFVERDRQGWSYVGTAQNDNGKTFQLWSRGSEDLHDLILPVIRASSAEMGGTTALTSLNRRPLVPDQPASSCGHIARRRYQPPRAS